MLIHPPSALFRSDPCLAAKFLDNSARARGAGASPRPAPRPRLSARLVDSVCALDSAAYRHVAGPAVPKQLASCTIYWARLAPRSIVRFFPSPLLGTPTERASGV